MEREPYEAVYRQVDPGRFEEAGLVVTSWLQGTSRDGDPQDHVHDQIAQFPDL